MKGKTVLIVLIAVLATAASTFVATRAITGTVTAGRTTSASADAGPGEIQSKGVEVTTLVEDIEASSDEEAVKSSDRDPMVTYKAPSRPKPATTTTTTTKPSGPTWPAYTVTAVLVGDDDPRAFMKLGGESMSVRVGDQITGGIVMAIESDGVTIESEAGATKKYPF
jgi:hypothetical protein